MQCSPGCSQQVYFFHSAREKTDMEKLNTLPGATSKEVATGAAVTRRQHFFCAVVSDNKGRLDRKHDSETDGDIGLQRRSRVKTQGRLPGDRLPP